MIEPLRGAKTHPLSEHTLAELRELDRKPVPACSINPGVVNRLLRGGLADLARLPSPFKADRGKLRDHLRITAAGRQALEASGGA